MVHAGFWQRSLGGAATKPPLPPADVISLNVEPGTQAFFEVAVQVVIGCGAHNMGVTTLQRLKPPSHAGHADLKVRTLKLSRISFSTMLQNLKES